MRYAVDPGVMSDFVENIHEGRLIRNWGKIAPIPPEFHEEMKSHNFFYLPPETSIDVMDRIIDRFLNYIENDGTTYIIECAVLQNPMRLILLNNNMSVRFFDERIEQICGRFSRCKSALFMNYHDDASDIFLNGSRRGSSWIDACVNEFTCNEYGRQRGFAGSTGTAAAYCELQDIQLSAFRELQCEKYLIDNSRFENGNRDTQVTEILSDMFGARAT